MYSKIFLIRFYFLDFLLFFVSTFLVLHKKYLELIINLQYSVLHLCSFYCTIMWGADSKTVTVAIIVNSVKTIKQNLKRREN